MRKVVILPLASRDILEAAKWYNCRQNGLGRKFTSQVRKSVDFIKAHPEVAAVRYEKVRTVLIESFPYMIHYFIEPLTFNVVVVAVLHTSRDPRLWIEKD